MISAPGQLLNRSIFLQAIALWGFAVAQPLYDLIARYPEFLAVKRISSAELILFAIALSFLAPLMLFAVTRLLGRFLPRCALLFWILCVIILLLLIADLLLKACGVVGWKRLLVGASAISLCGTYLYLKFRTLRSYLSLLAVAGVLFPLVFLFQPKVKTFLWRISRNFQSSAAVPSKPAPIVVVVFDELPLISLLKEKNQIDREHFPHFAKLVDEATWFPNTWAASSDTTTAVPAIQTGRLPSANQLPRFEDQPQNIFTLLGPHFNVQAHETITSLCPVELCLLTRESFWKRLESLLSDLAIVYAHRVVPVYFSDRLPSVGMSWGDFVGAARPENSPNQTADTGADQPVKAFEQFIHGLGAGKDGATFSYLHVLLPHPPWRYFPSGRSYTSPAGSTRIGGLATSDTWKSDEETVAQGYLMHLLQLQYTDTLLGKLVRKLKHLEVFDDALIVVTADHGTSFRAETPRRAPVEATLVDTLQVPLIVKLPRQREAAVDTRNAQTIDILPTIAEVVGMQLPWPVEGVSLLGSEVAPRTEVRFLDSLKELKHRKLQDFDLNEALRHRSELIENYFSRISRSWKSDRIDPLPTHTAAGLASCSAWLEAPGVFTSVALDMEVLPALLRAEISCTGLPKGPVQVAVMFNGSPAGRRTLHIVGTGTDSFSLLIDEMLFRGGYNEISLAVVVGDNKILVPVALNGDDRYRLSSNERGEKILKSAYGEEIILSPSGMRGFLDILRVSSGRAFLEGWAVDAEKKTRATQIAIFCDDRFLTSVPTIVERHDVAALFPGADLLQSGFQANISLGACAGKAPHRLRLFAMGAHAANELSYGSDPRRVSEIKLGE